MNRAKNGDHYWVFAHVTPSFDGSGNISGYHSSRRVPERRVLDETIIPLYKSLLEEEERHESRKDVMHAAYQSFVNLLLEKKVNYDELVFAL